MLAVVDRLAAGLAHRLNADGAETLWLDAGGLYGDLLNLIETRYAVTLLYHPGYAWRMGADEAASRYFDATLGRKLRLSGKVPYSAAHRLFLALVQRLPEPGWRMATLQRARDRQAAAPALIPRAAAQALEQRLDKLGRQIGAGNAALQIRERDGPLWLTAGHICVELPEEMSLWDCVVAIPPKLLALASGEPFNQFCGQVIDALRTANRPVQEVLGLGHGLCPFDWLDVLSTSQVRSLRRFLAALPEGKGLSDLPEAALRGQWQAQPVAGFRDFEAFWGSEIARALRQPRQGAYGGTLDDVAVSEAVDDSQSQDAILSASEWSDALTRHVAAGHIRLVEARMLARLYAGASFIELEAEPVFQAEINRCGGLVNWANKLMDVLAHQDSDLATRNP